MGATARVAEIAKSTARRAGRRLYAERRRTSAWSRISPFDPWLSNVLFRFLSPEPAAPHAATSGNSIWPTAPCALGLTSGAPRLCCRATGAGGASRGRCFVFPAPGAAEIGHFAMAKAASLKIKLLSTADTGYFYVTKKNARTKTEKLTFKKYDPVARKHVEFKETKIK